ncbi:MAG: DUF1003 domain-containing protein [Patescibacteria group bacterium]
MAGKKHESVLLELWESVYGAVSPDRTERANQVHELYHSFRAKSLARRRPIDVFADKVIGAAGTIPIVELHIVVFVCWILINTGVLPVVPVFDPYPFGFLTMMISIEAIFLSLLILIGQNRQSVVADLREEMNFQITVQSEQEVTKLLKLVKEIHEHHGLALKRDNELERMTKKLDTSKLEAQIEHEFEATEHGGSVVVKKKITRRR